MPELSTQEWKSVFDQLAQQGCLYLTLIGGEVFARRDFFELAEYAKQKHFVMRLITNGTYISDSIALRLKNLGIMSMDVSLYGAKRETYEQVTHHPKGFEMALNGIEALLRHGHRVTLKIPLMKENFDDFKTMASMAEAWGVNIQYDPLLTPMTDSANMQPVLHRLSRDQLKEFYGWQNQPVVAKLRMADDMICVSGRNTITVSPFGDLYPCMQIKKALGNVRENSIAQVWQNSPDLKRMRDLRFKHLSGYNDKQKSHCVICPGVALLEEGNIGAKSDYICQMGEVKEELGLVAKSGEIDSLG